MRVCILNDNFYRGSGIALAIKRLVRSPCFADIDVYLAGCEKVTGKYKSMHEDTTIVAADRYRFFPLMESNIALFPALYRFADWVRKMRFDVIHVHHRRLAVLANLIRPLTQTPVLFTGHLTFPEVTWFRELAPKTMTAVSPSVAEYLRRCTKARKISLIYNPVDFPKKQADAEVFYRRSAISVGRLEPVKGYDTLIEAWYLLRKKGVNAQLDIFGEGSLRETLEMQIANLDLQDHVKLHGFTSNIPERLATYAFNILSSQREGFPNAVVEAAAHGIPTLLTDVDGSRDALPPDLILPNGLPYGDAYALSNAITRWLESPEMIRTDGRRFHDYLELRCSPAIVGQLYLEAYSSLLDGNNK